MADDPVGTPQQFEAVHDADELTVWKEGRLYAVRLVNDDLQSVLVAQFSVRAMKRLAKYITDTSS